MPREVIDYKALAERIELYASLGVEGCDRWRADLRTVVTMLEGMADEKPALWMQSNHVSWAGKQPFMARCAPTQLQPDFVPLHLHPAPQPQRPYGTDTMSEMGIVPMCDEPERQPVSEPRSCTCHPDDNPPVPCAQQYALSECRAASEPTEAQIDAKVVAGLDAIEKSMGGIWSVTQLRRSVRPVLRAALAAKEQPK